MAISNREAVIREFRLEGQRNASPRRGDTHVGKITPGAAAASVSGMSHGRGGSHTVPRLAALPLLCLTGNGLRHGLVGIGYRGWPPCPPRSAAAWHLSHRRRRGVA